ncbi:DUF5819 family protein [Streptomyces alboflavus]|uniref:DUF5819 family protein n=1 Tax=Streptomyces alboflavus TaxID=67267 RepID=UPI003677048C
MDRHDKDVGGESAGSDAAPTGSDAVPTGPDAAPTGSGATSAPTGSAAASASADSGAAPAPAPAPTGSAAPAPAPAPADSGAAPARTGLAALSRRSQVVAALVLAVVVATVCVHVGMVFLHVAPSNTVSKEHGRTVDDWIYPEFEQNWKLFAPNPLQQNVAVQVRAQIRTADGADRTTRWYDLSAQDGAAIDHNLLPSHTQQNELRRGWDFFVSTHDAQNRPTGLRGELSERYIRRMVLLRLHRHEPLARGEAFDQVQVRSRTTAVQPPEWSDEKINGKPVLRVLPWWSVTPGDLPLAGADRARRDVAVAQNGGVR